MSTAAPHQAAGDALRDKVARALEPSAFASWDDGYDRAIEHGDPEAAARSFAEWCGGKGCQRARDEADRIARDPDAGLKATLRALAAENALKAEAAARATAEAERDEARADAEKAESEAEELRGTPWPEWAERCLKVIRAHSGYDGYDDAADGVDLPGELEETLNEYEAEAKRQRHEARAKHETDRHKAAVEHYQDQVRKLCGRVDAAESRVASLIAEQARLKAAAEPFANLSFSFDGFSAEPAALVFQGVEFGQFDCAHHSAFEKMIDDLRAALDPTEAADA